MLDQTIEQIKTVGQRIDRSSFLMEQFILQAPFPVAMIDLDFLVLLHSNLYKELAGICSEANMIGMELFRAWKLDPYADATLKFKASVQELKDGESFSFHGSVTNTQNKQVWYNTKVQPIFAVNGEPIKIGYIIWYNIEKEPRNGECKKGEGEWVQS